MALTFTLAGVARTSYVSIPDLRISMNYRSGWTAELVVKDTLSTSGAYRPALDDTIVIADGATTVFRGWVFRVVDEPVAAPRIGTLTRVSCRSYDAYLDSIIVDKVYGTDPLGIANSSVANPVSLTTVQPHGFVTGARVVIEDHVGSVAGVNGTHVVTVTSHSTFTVPVNNTTSGGGGTVRQVTPADDVVADLHAAYLNSRGVSLDTLAAAGDLSKQVYTGVTLRSVLDHIAQITGWIYRVTPAPQLQFFAAGTKSASYSLTSAVGGLNVGPVTWEQQRQRYIDKVFLRYGTDSVQSKTQTITLDGSTNLWILDYPPATDADGTIMSAGYVNENASINYPLAPLTDLVSSSVANPTTITTLQPHGMDPATAHTVIVQSHTGSTPAISGGYTATITGKFTFTIPVNVTVAGSGGQVYENGYTWLYYKTGNALFRVGAGTAEQIALFTYSAQFPATVTAGSGTWEGVYEAPEIFDVHAAQELADGILRREQAKPKLVRTSTRQTSLLMPGDQITLTFTDRTISGAHIIQAVDVTASVDQRLRYALTAVTGTDFQDTALDIQRDALGGGGLQASGGTISGGAVSSPSGIASDNLLAQAGRQTTEVEAGSVSGGSVTSLVTGLRMARTNPWVVGVRPSQAPGSAGYEYVWFDTRLSEAYPTLRLVDNGTHVILALNATFTGTVRAVQIGENASGKRFAAVHALKYYTGGGAALGDWTTPAYSAGNFTASAGTWTVDSGDVQTYAYTVVGSAMTVLFEIGTTDISASPTTLRIAIPGGYTAAKQTRNAITIIDAGGAAQIGQVVAAVGAAYLACYKDLTGSTAWTTTGSDNTWVLGQITLEVA